MSFDLASLVNASEIFPPQRVLCYGVQGLGKSTFGATFERPILLRTEDGAGAIDIPTFPHVAKHIGEIYQALQSLFEQEHNFKTLVIDSLDWLEPLVFGAVCEKHNVHNIEDIGYGKGYVYADDEWRNVLAWFDSLRHNKGMTIILIAHSEIKTFNAPDSESYDRYQLKMQKRAFALCQEWADMVLFCNYKKHVKTDKQGNTLKRAEGSGERIIYTQERPAYLAKNRWSLPEEITINKDKTWFNFHEALEKATNGKYKNPQKEQ